MNSATDFRIEFPLYDISEFGWNEFKTKEHNIIFQNPYPGIVPYQKNKFKERLKRYEFVDCKGEVYKVSDVTFIKSKGIRGFFMLSSLVHLDFQSTGRKLSIEEFKELVIGRAEETNNIKLEEAARQATSIADVLKPSEGKI